jgi:thymidylate synthase (FAD)
MNIVEPYARMLSCTKEKGIQALQNIEWIGRISHRSEEAQTATSWERFIKAVVLTHGDWSITEHVSMTVDAVVDRGITHEWVRHRIGAYTQESTRFVNYEKKRPAEFIKPQLNNGHAELCWETVIEVAEAQYRKLVLDGCSPQIARSVLPNSLASRLIVTYNLRNWRHFFLMRTTAESHPQMRQVTIPLLKEFQEKIPLLYDDIVPNSRQIDNLQKAR